MVNLLTARSRSLFHAVGGWRTAAEAIVSRMVFLVVYVFTGQVVLSALVAVGGVLALAVIRVFMDHKWWQAVIPLFVVGVSALLAGSTGRGVDFYFLDVVRTLGAALVMLVSIVIRWPIVGLVVGATRGERFGWRRDRVRFRRYQLCTAVFLAKFVFVGAVILPLYLGGQVVALGITMTVLNTPVLACCLYVCWRILRADPTTKPLPSQEMEPSTR